MEFLKFAPARVNCGVNHTEEKNRNKFQAKAKGMNVRYKHGAHKILYKIYYN